MEVKEYLELPYNISIRHIKDDSGEYYFAKVQEFDGCMSDGETFEEAYKNITEAMEGWIETKLEAGYTIPMPPRTDLNEYSGRFNIRIPKSLHARLVSEASCEGVSLNQYTLYTLSKPNKHRGTSIDDALAEEMKDPEFKAEYDALQPEFAIIRALINARKNNGLTQKQLAQKTGIDQADISKLENGDANPSLKTLQRLAIAMGTTLKIEFIPNDDEYIE